MYICILYVYNIIVYTIASATIHSAVSNPLHIIYYNIPRPTRYYFRTAAAYNSSGRFLLRAYNACTKI